MLARIVGEHLPAQPVHQLAQQDEIDVAIDEARTRRPVGLVVQGHVDSGLVAAPRWGQRQIGRQAGKVGEEVAHGDVAFAILEFGKVLGDAIVQAELALLEKLHQR